AFLFTSPLFHNAVNSAPRHGTRNAFLQPEGVSLMGVWSLILSILVFLAVGIIEGEILSFFAGDSKNKRLRDILVGVLCSAGGWLFGILLPVMPQYRFST